MSRVARTVISRNRWLSLISKILLAKINEVMDRKPTIEHRIWNGKRGLSAFICWVVACGGFNWFAWIGAPVRGIGNQLALGRSKGLYEPTTVTMWWFSQGIVILTMLAIAVFIILAVYYTNVPLTKKYPYSFAKPMLLLLIVSMISIVVGMFLA